MCWGCVISEIMSLRGIHGISWDNRHFFSCWLVYVWHLAEPMAYWGPREVLVEDWEWERLPIILVSFYVSSNYPFIHLRLSN
jgi:hypothetical protein